MNYTATTIHYNNIVDIYDTIENNDKNFMDSLDDVKLILNYISKIQLIEAETGIAISIKGHYDSTDRENFRVCIDSNLKLVENLNNFFEIQTSSNGTYFLKLL